LEGVTEMKLNELLGIKYPLIQGAMANIATAKFAATVSNAGGLGILGAGAMYPEDLDKALEEIKTLTDKPFGVNLMLMNPHSPDMVDIIIKHGVKIVTTGAGNPGPHMEKFKEAGIKVIPVVPTVALAKRVAKAGADAVIVEGTEAGGHVGELTTMALVPQVVEAVDIPVIAAGGIASGKQLVAAFALGAIGVQVGTILLTAHECAIHENFKQAVIKAKDTSTVVTGRPIGIPIRGLKNSMTREYIQLEQSGKTKMELEHLALGALKRAVFEGDVERGSVMMGQVAGMITEEKSVVDTIKDLFDDADKEFEALKKAW
jgi:enoyl-[acyl-carrier protein] reductase II